MKKLEKCLAFVLALSIITTTMLTTAFASSTEPIDADDGELVASFTVPLNSAIVALDADGTVSPKGAQVEVRARFDIRVYTNHTIETTVTVEEDTLFPIASYLKVKSFKVDIKYMDMTNFDIPVTFDHATISTNNPGPILDGTITSIPFPKGDTVSVGITVSNVVLENVTSWESNPVSFSKSVVIR